MSTNWPWSELELNGATSVREVKRAYAKKLKQIDRDNPKSFQSLRAAYEHALDLCETDNQTEKPIKITARETKQQLSSLPETPQSHNHDSPSVQQDLALELKSLCVIPLPINSLEAFINKAEKENMAWKSLMEHSLFDILSEAIDDHNTIDIVGSEAEFLDTHFAWVRDGVGFNNKFAYDPNALPVIHAVSRALALSRGIDPAIIESLEYRGVGLYRFWCFCLWTLVVLYVGSHTFGSKNATLSFADAGIKTLIAILTVLIAERTCWALAYTTRKTLNASGLMAKINKILALPSLRKVRHWRENRASHKVWRLAIAIGVCLMVYLFLRFL